MMSFIRVALIVFVIICILMRFRNEYVYSVYEQILEAIYLYTMSDLDINAKRAYMRLYSYNTMLFRFWVFGWRQFMPDDLADKIAPYMRIVQMKEKKNEYRY